MLLALITCHVRRDLLNHVRCVEGRHVVIVVGVVAFAVTLLIPTFETEDHELRNWTSSRLHFPGDLNSRIV